MLFTTPTFLFAFLPVVLGGYFLLPGMAARNGWLLALSLLFYSWGEGAHLALLVASVAMNYGLGLALARARGRPGAGALVALAVVANLALMGSYKYAHALHAAFALAGLPAWSGGPAHLPIGLSFFTFQALSYVLDVARGRSPVQRNPLMLGLYIALFPQLILGPIVRYRDVARQLSERQVTVQGFNEGIARFVIGLGKKVLLADTLAPLADRVFALPEAQLTFGAAWLGVLAFSLQLYFDFSAYADMAIGLGRMFGFRFQENFRHPYAARSRTEFFQRWHISFFTWLRDYLYRPLTPKGSGDFRQNANILLVFLCAGLWHGAAGTYLAWGLFHGSVLVLERQWLGRHLARTWLPLRHAYVMAVTFASNAFFRASTLHQSLALLLAMGGLGALPRPGAGTLLTPDALLALLVGVPASLPLLPWLQARWQALRPRLPERHGAALESVALASGRLALAALLLAAVLVISASTYEPFIYFRF